MRAIVIGGGIAGLGAAFRLRDAGHEVVLLERETEPGGRCRSLEWHGLWIARGAFAFIGSETNLIEQARRLGIHTADAIEDMTPWHRWNVLVKRARVARFEEFSLLEAARNPLIPLGEKARLLATLPGLLTQILAGDPRDITSSVAFDDVNACEYFRRYSPTFVDYFLEPCVALFCGYGADDYSLAWVLWGASGRHAWANHWWSYKERGVGQLTWALGAHLAADPGCDYRLDCTAVRVHVRRDGVTVDVHSARGDSSTAADAAVIAVPGTRVAALLPDLDAQRREFFQRIEYAGHHVFYLLLDRPKGSLPDSYVLPTADGHARSTHVYFSDLGNGTTLASSEWKDRACREHAQLPDAALLDLAWSDFLDVAPELAGTRVADRFLSRQPEAICKRPKGYIRGLEAFRDLGPLPRLAFAGDYLINSTVGQAHWSGLRAADELVRRYG
jgi:oxygen-dependent protoporphyrinogen oxidase